MTARKRYLISLFLKRCTVQGFQKTYLDSSFQLFCGTYNISPEKLEELKARYTHEVYLERLIPIIDKHFFEEELEDAIRFFSSAAGKKMLSSSFLKQVGDVGERLFAEIEQEFALAANRKQ